MYEQILTHKGGTTVKILGVCGEIIFISQACDYKTANGSYYTKEDLIELGFIFPVEKWTPELREKYYIPYAGEDKYDYEYWHNNDYENYRLANNLVCRTKEEAIALTDKMLGAVK